MVPPSTCYAVTVILGDVQCSDVVCCEGQPNSDLHLGIYFAPDLLPVFDAQVIINN